MQPFSCITDNPGFHTVCLNRWVLQSAWLCYKQQYGSQAHGISRAQNSSPYCLPLACAMVLKDMSVVIFNNTFDDFLISIPLSNIIWDVLNISTNEEPEGFLLLPARSNWERNKSCSAILCCELHSSTLPTSRQWRRLWVCWISFCQWITLLFQC